MSRRQVFVNFFNLGPKRYYFVKEEYRQWRCLFGTANVSFGVLYSTDFGGGGAFVVGCDSPCMGA